MGTQKLRVPQNQQGFVRGLHILHFGSARPFQAYGRKLSSEKKQFPLQCQRQGGNQDMDQGEEVDLKNENGDKWQEL